MRTDRGPDELRRVTIQRGYTEMTPGSVLIAMGHTRVLCTVSFDFDVPPWMRSKGEGWVTAEYAMLPGSGRERISRGAIRGGRVKEIQRLIGRSLRAAVDLAGDARGDSEDRLRTCSRPMAVRERHRSPVPGWRWPMRLTCW